MSNAARETGAASAGPVAIVTGGSRGIGLAVARLLGAQGYRVALVARGARDLDRAAEEIRAAGAECLALVADVAVAESVERAFGQVQAAYHALDLVVHCAAILRVGRFDEIPLDAYKASIDVNYLGAVHVARSAAARLGSGGGGQLVQVASVIAIRSFPGFSAYAPSKWALRAFHETVAMELAGSPVRLCLVYPPITDTPMIRELGVDARPAVYDAFRSHAAETVAAAIVRGIRRGSPRIFVRRLDWLYFHLVRLAPGTTGLVLDYLVARRTRARRARRLR